MKKQLERKEGKKKEDNERRDTENMEEEAQRLALDGKSKELMDVFMNGG